MIVFFPWFNAILTFLKGDGSGDKTALQLTPNGRVPVDSGSTIEPTVSTTPPTPATNGQQWLHDGGDWKELMQFDASRNFWLSVQATPYRFGADSTDNSALRSSDVHTPGTGAAHTIPLDAMITRISATSRAGLATKGFDIVSDGSNGTTVVSSFNLVGNSFINNNANNQLSANDELWVNSQGAGGSASDIVVTLWVKWRVAP